MKKRNFAKKHQFKRYEARRLKNPYFKHKRPQFRISWKMLAVLFGLVFVFCFIFYSPLLRVDNVSISGTEHFSPDSISDVVYQELGKARFLLLPGNHWLLIHEERIMDALYTQFVFDSVQMERVNRTLEVTVKERVSTLVWQTQTHSYYVDLTGTIIREIPDVSTDTVFTYPVYVDSHDLPAAIGQKVLTETMIQGTINFLTIAEEKGIELDHFQHENQEDSWLSVRTGDGYWVLFDPEQDIAQQVENLEAVLKDSIEAPGMIQYIDLRFGDHVYYK